MIRSVKQLYKLYRECSGVSTDSRTIDQDTLFVALKGPNFNANKFAGEALEKGARYALVDDRKYADGRNVFLVHDGLTSLQELAQYHRNQLDIPLVGITGSNGKTTTKELVFKVLTTTFKTLATRGNLNNHIGVPLTLLAVKPEIEIAIVEMGANHLGEIASLCKIARPTYGLITNIGRAHTKGFGGFEGVIRGKSELYHFLIQNHGVVFVNSQDEILTQMAKRFDRPYFYPAEGDFLHITYTRSDPYLNFIGERNREVKTRLIGEYNFYNVAAAMCVGKYFGVRAELMEAAVSEYVPANNRSQVIKKGTNTIILDAYNANPSSMKAALKNLLSMDVANKVAVLGDMMELGDESEAAHQELVQSTVNGLSQALLCGERMYRAKDMNENALYFTDRQKLEDYLRKHAIKNSTILIKASRSMGLEKVVEFL